MLIGLDFEYCGVEDLPTQIHKIEESISTSVSSLPPRFSTEPAQHCASVKVQIEMPLVPTSRMICLISALQVFLSTSAALAEGIFFQPVGDEETQLRMIMQTWHDEELQRQGGEFVSHGWWPWGLRAFDYDRDGDLDLIASHHGKPGSTILKSHFRETGKLRFTNATRELGIDSRDLPGADDRPWI